MEKDNNKNFDNDGNFETEKFSEEVKKENKEVTKPIVKMRNDSNNKKKKKRRKKRKVTFFSVIITVMLITFALILAGAVCVFQIIDEYTHTDCGEKSVTVTIPDGASGEEIAKILKENGVIKNELAFRLKLKNSPYRNELKSGTFELKENMPYNDIIDVLRISPKQEGIAVTIPEGYSVEMIAQLFEDKGFVKKDEFLKELEEGSFDYEFIKDIPDTPGVKYKLQGYLFPSTHHYSKDADAHEIIDTLLGEFENQYNNAKGDTNPSLSMNEIIIRASLIEREAKLDSERATISGVIQNRIKAGMLLQIDAAVVYAISDGMYNIDRVLYDDLEIDSPYNLYKNKGLPPGAICNPGAKAIIAAMNPESHKYLYYHTDTEKNDGSHIFTETFSQHTGSMR